jgi:hypothetical protein
MTLSQIEKRLEALEQTVQALQSPRAQPGRWWVEQAGRFANDSVYDEIVRRGKSYRQSQRPKPRKRGR